MLFEKDDDLIWLQLPKNILFNSFDCCYTPTIVLGLGLDYWNGDSVFASQKTLLKVYFYFSLFKSLPISLPESGIRCFARFNFRRGEEGNSDEKLVYLIASFAMFACPEKRQTITVYNCFWATDFLVTTFQKINFSATKVLAKQIFGRFRRVASRIHKLSAFLMSRVGAR